MIYFITDYEYIKIGTTVDLLNRFNSLQSNNPKQLYVLATTEGSYKEEKELHNKFKNYRYNREWFYYSKEIKDFVETIKEWDITVNDTIIAVNLYNTLLDDISRTRLHVMFKCKYKGSYYAYDKTTNLLKYTVPLVLKDNTNNYNSERPVNQQ